MSRIMGRITAISSEESTSFFSSKPKTSIEIDGSYAGPLTPGLYDHVMANFQIGDIVEYCDDDGVLSVMSEAFCLERDKRNEELRKSAGFWRSLFF